MTTSGTAGFNLDLSELVEEAFERCGKELRTGYDLRTARRSLNLLTIEWANRGINLWTIEQGSIPLVTGQATYDLPVDTIDLLDTVIRTGSGQNQIDINISRISESTYSTIPNKNAQARPIQVWINRQSGADYPTTGTNPPKIVIWPTPNAPGDQYTFVYWRLRRIQDSGGGVSTQDIPFRFLTCMVAGLAFYLSAKLPEVDPQRVLFLKSEYEQQFQLAADEDREKAPLRFVPRSSFYY
tara:strand:+ start:1024 stop:1743 length:720 start_codon:yes stop_codon:yes gene_type:complete